MLFNSEDQRSRNEPGGWYQGGEGDDYKALVNVGDGAEWSPIPLWSEGVQGEPQDSRIRHWCVPSPSDHTRQRYAKVTGPSKLVVTASLFMIIIGAFFINEIVWASLNIQIPDPNSPTPKELLIPVGKLSVRRVDMSFILPVPPAVASTGYKDLVVSWEVCSSWNKICRVLKRDGEV